MRVFRLGKAAHARSVMDGEGARLWGGRWNPPGLPVVYTSESLALAVLEQLVHADLADLPDDLVATTLEIPDALPVATLDDLPARWRDHPAPSEVQALGAAWLEAEETPVLRVPSAVLPREHNRLINPRHPLAARIHVVGNEPFAWDPRLSGIDR